MMLDNLRAFVAVAKYLNLREAASELNLTPPAVSKRLTALQRELGAKLYKPTRQGIELTVAGRGALAKIEAIVKQADELLMTFGRPTPQARPAEVFSVAGAYSLGVEFLPALIARFERAHPGTQVDCHTGSSQQIQQMIREGRAEIGLSTYPPRAADFYSEPFRVQNLVFFVSPSHPMANRRRINLVDLLAYPLVVRSAMGGSTWTQDILNQLSERGFKFRIALECHGPNQVKGSVAKNIGVGISYLENLTADVASGRFIVLRGADFQFTTLSYVLFSKKRGLSRAAHEFLNLLRRARRVPDGHKLAEITALTKKRGLSLVRKSLNLVRLIPLVAVPVLELFGKVLI